MCFPIFQPEDMPNLCLSSNESQVLHAFKRYDYKKQYNQSFQNSFPKTRFY